MTCAVGRCRDYPSVACQPRASWPLGECQCDGAGGSWVGRGGEAAGGESCSIRQVTDAGFSDHLSCNLTHDPTLLSSACPHGPFLPHACASAHPSPQGHRSPWALQAHTWGLSGEWTPKLRAGSWPPWCGGPGLVAAERSGKSRSGWSCSHPAGGGLGAEE